MIPPALSYMRLIIARRNAQRAQYACERALAGVILNCPLPGTKQKGTN